MRIVLAFQEERFNKIKNLGYPKISIEKCIDYVYSKNFTIDEAAFSTIENIVFPFKYPVDNYFSIRDWLGYYHFYSTKRKD